MNIGDKVVISNINSVNSGRQGTVYSVASVAGMIGVEFSDGTKLPFSIDSLMILSNTNDRFIAGWTAFDEGDIDFDSSNPVTKDTLINAVYRNEMTMNVFSSEDEFEENLKEDMEHWDYAVGLKDGKIFFASSKVQIDYEAD